ENRRSRARTTWPLPELFERFVFLWVVDMARECGAEVSVVAGGVGDQVIPPVVENPAVRIGKAVADVGFKFSRARLEAINRGVFIKLKTGRAVEIVDEMRALVGLPIPVGVLKNQNAVAGARRRRALRIIRPD